MLMSNECSVINCYLRDGMCPFVGDEELDGKRSGIFVQNP